MVIVASTQGSVMNELLKNSFFRRQIHSVVSDRLCPAVERAQAHGVQTMNFSESDKHRFCDKLLIYLHENWIDYVISFFTKLFVGDLLNAYEDRIINLHPALLPAFKGMDGFGDGIRYGVRYLGSTIHFVDEHMDEGKIIMQTICPLDPSQEISTMRHRIFRQQCKSLLQVVKWLTEDRIKVESKKVLIEGAVYVDFEYSPNLDFHEAIALDV